MVSSDARANLRAEEHNDTSIMGSHAGLPDQSTDSGAPQPLYPRLRLGTYSTTQSVEQVSTPALVETPSGFWVPSSLEEANNFRNSSSVGMSEGLEYEQLPSQGFLPDAKKRVPVLDHQISDRPWSNAKQHSFLSTANGSTHMPHVPLHQPWSSTSKLFLGSLDTETPTLQSGTSCEESWSALQQPSSDSDYGVQRLFSKLEAVVKQGSSSNINEGIEDGFFTASYFGLDDSDTGAPKYESFDRATIPEDQFESGKKLSLTDHHHTDVSEFGIYPKDDTEGPRRPWHHATELREFPVPLDNSLYPRGYAKDSPYQIAPGCLHPLQYRNVEFDKLAPNEVIPTTGSEADTSIGSNMDLLDDADQATLAISRTKLKYGSREQAKQVIDNAYGQTYQPPRDDTFPTDEEEEAVCAVVLLDATLQMEEAEDSTSTTEGWKKIIETRRSEVELAVWTVLDKMIDYHNRKGFLGKHQFSSKATAKYGTFAEHLRAISAIFRRSKTVCRHLLQEPYIVSLVDDPEALAKRVRGNRNVNDSKKSVNKTNADLANAIFAAQEQGNGLTKEELAELASKSTKMSRRSRKYAAKMEVSDDGDDYGEENGPQKKRKTSTAAEAETVQRRTRGSVSSTSENNRSVGKRQAVRKGRPRGSKTATMRTTTPM